MCPDREQNETEIRTQNWKQSVKEDHSNLRSKLKQIIMSKINKHCTSHNAENVLLKYVFMVPYNLAGSGFRSRLNAELTGIPTNVSHTSGPNSQDQMTDSLS